MQVSYQPVKSGTERFQEITGYLPHCKPSGQKLAFRCPCHPDSHHSAVAFPPNADDWITLYCSVCGPKSGIAIAAALGIPRELLAGYNRRTTPLTTFGPPPVAKPRRIEFTPPEDAARFARKCYLNMPPLVLADHARDLGVAQRALDALGVGWNNFKDGHAITGGCTVYDDHFTYPEFSPNLLTVGITRRFADGTKRQRFEDGRGLAIPVGAAEEAARVGYCFFPEGHSDTAAIYTMNLPAVGRPSNNSGHEYLGAFCQAVAAVNSDFVAVVVAERDRRVDPKTGRASWPGRTGAIETANRLRGLGLRACVVLPPGEYKDSRAWLQAQPVNPENIPACLTAAKDYLAGVELIDGEPMLDFLAISSPVGGHTHSSTVSSQTDIAKKSNKLTYEAGPCPNARTVCLESKDRLGLERRFILARCGKAGCDPCLPARRLHWFEMLLRYTFPFHQNLYYAEFPVDMPNSTIQRRVERTGDGSGEVTIVTCADKQAVFSTVPLLESTQVTGVPHLIELINASILAVDALEHRPVNPTAGMRPPKEPTKPAEWKTIGSAPAVTYFRAKQVARDLGLKFVPGRARGAKVCATATFKLRAEWTLEQRDAITQWLMIGRKPPPTDPFRRPTIHDIWNSGVVTPKRYKPRKQKAVPV
jgi:hypothetical protein